MSKLDKMGSKSAIALPLQLDLDMFPASGKVKRYAFGEVLGWSNHPGFSIFKKMQDAVKYATKLKEIFGLSDSDDFVIVYQASNVGDRDIKSVPNIRTYEGKLVLFLPKHSTPIAISQHLDFVGSKAVLAGLMIPVSVDMDVVKTSFGEITDDNRQIVEFAMKSALEEGDYSFVNEWKTPGEGSGVEFTVLKEMDLGAFWCHSVWTTKNKFEGKSITGGKLVVTTMEGDRMWISCTESVAKQVLSAFSVMSLSSQYSNDPENKAIADPEKGETERRDPVKPFLILFAHKKEDSRGTTCTLLTFLPDHLDPNCENFKIDGRDKRLFTSLGLDPAELFRQWLEKFNPQEFVEESFSDAPEIPDTDKAPF